MKKIKIIRDKGTEIATIPIDENTKLTKISEDRLGLAFCSKTMIDIQTWDCIQIDEMKYYPIRCPEIGKIPGIFIYNIELSKVQTSKKGLLNH